MLPVSNRLKDERALRRLLSRNTPVVAGRFLLIKTIPTSSKEAKFACIVGKQVSKKAVERNYYRRILSEIIREYILPSVAAKNYVILLKPQGYGKSFSTLKEEITTLFHKL